jgi:citrate synthase
MAAQNATLSFNGEAIELPVYEPTLGKPVIDVSSLGTHGAFTFDPGFMATAACESKITFIDGEKGVLLYRGYPVGDLADKSHFLEVCHLLLHGDLPNPETLKHFSDDVTSHMAVDPLVAESFKAFNAKSHPMAMTMSAISTLAGLNHDGLDITDEKTRLDVATRLIAKIPTITAMCYRHGKGEAFVAPRNDLNYSENFWHMMFGKADQDDEINPVISKALDTIFTLHADHEQNASTSTVRLAGSTGTDPYAAIVSGVAALWGPAHGGANEAALNMLREIGSVDNIPKYIAKAKDKSDPFRLMGFGHRVYKNYDPRANVMRSICHDVLEVTGAHDDELFKVAMALEKVALEDEYFIKRKLYPNVDFYSGITQSALGIPSTLFTVIFTLGRMVGWIAHWHEMLSEPHRIGRPRQLYTGHDKRDYPA